MEPLAGQHLKKLTAVLAFAPNMNLESKTIDHDSRNCLHRFIGSHLKLTGEELIFVLEAATNLYYRVARVRVLLLK